MSEQNQDKPAITDRDPKEAKYQVAGQEVILTKKIVRDFLVRGEGQVSDQDITLFISICKYNQLNPFLNEAYLVKYGASSAQMVVSKEAFLKRADVCENYEGFQAGIIVIRNNEAVELEGCFHLPGDKLAGGWAKVYRSDKRFPVVARVRMEEYNKKQSTWNEKPATMIAKVAKVQALREAFPAQLGAMYTQEETDIVDTDYEDMTVKNEAKAFLASENAEYKPEIASSVTPNAEPSPNKKSLL
jgi:phage recombination protein Bet